MREVDRLTTEKYGIPPIILMENAAHAAARIITDALGGSVRGRTFLILCGKGNNGGDGAALARVLWMAGAETTTYLFGRMEETKGEARQNFEILQNISHSPQIFDQKNNYAYFFELGDPEEWSDSFGGYCEEEVIVDALFGTGLSRPADEPLARIIDNLNHWKNTVYQPLIFSVDIPSGLNSDVAERIGENFFADLTVTFTAPKPANVLPPAANFNGEIFVANIGSPQKLIDSSPSQTFLAEEKDVYEWMRETEFSPDSYKKKRGSALLVVGSKNYTGAAVLAGNAAIRTGAGLATIVTSERAQPAVAARVLPEVIIHGAADTRRGALSAEAFDKIVELIGRADVVAIGSGLGSDEETTRQLVRRVVENRSTPVVVDADGLNSLAPFDLEGSAELPLILTPHEGEFLRLLGIDDKEAIRDRVAAVRDFSAKHKVILVLKGERTLIAEPGGRVVINPTGNAGLGKAGNGDNLTGVITGFIAQAVRADLNVFRSVVAAVYLAGLAGDLAEKKHGKRTMLAGDVIECLDEAFRQVGEGDG